MRLDDVFPPMHKVITPRQRGNVKVDHYTVSEGESRMSALSGGLAYCDPGTYARLMFTGKHRDHCVMSDTRMERITNYRVAREARGNVLIAGFGLGMILIPILKNRVVKRVTVIENNPDVLALVKPQIEAHVGPRAARKLTTIVGDIHTWRPPTKVRQFDTIYFDIWTDVSTDTLTEMSALRRAFAGYLKVGGLSACWKQDYLRDEKRREGPY